MEVNPRFSSLSSPNYTLPNSYIKRIKLVLFECLFLHESHIALKEQNAHIQKRRAQNSESTQSPSPAIPALCQWQCFTHHENQTEPCHLTQSFSYSYSSTVVPQCPLPLLSYSKLLLPQSAALMWTVTQARYQQTDRNYSVLFKTVSKVKEPTFLGFLLKWLKMQTCKLRKFLLSKWMLAPLSAHRSTDTLPDLEASFVNAAKETIMSADSRFHTPPQTSPYLKAPPQLCRKMESKEWQGQLTALLLSLFSIWGSRNFLNHFPFLFAT